MSECLLIARIDGATEWADLAATAGMEPEAVDEALVRWLALGLVEVRTEPD